MCFVTSEGLNATVRCRECILVPPAVGLDALNDRVGHDLFRNQNGAVLVVGEGWRSTGETLPDQVLDDGFRLLHRRASDTVPSPNETRADVAGEAVQLLTAIRDSAQDERQRASFLNYPYGRKVRRPVAERLIAREARRRDHEALHCGGQRLVKVPRHARSARQKEKPRSREAAHANVYRALIAAEPGRPRRHRDVVDGEAIGMISQEFKPLCR